MSSPQFKSDNTEIFNKRVPLYELRKIDMRSLAGLYISELLLFGGMVLILLNNLNVLEPGSYFGAVNWVTRIVFTFGLVINFVSIPFLYFSSFQNFRRENDFWDKQTFWILPLFFFGTFYLYGSEMTYSMQLLIISLVIISVVHLRYILLSRNFLLRSNEEALESHHQYFQSLKYLSAYYLLLVLLMVFCNPIQQAFVWIRHNF